MDEERYKGGRQKRKEIMNVPSGAILLSSSATRAAATTKNKQQQLQQQKKCNAGSVTPESLVV